MFFGEIFWLLSKNSNFQKTNKPPTKRGNVTYFPIFLATELYKYKKVGIEPVKLIPAKWRFEQIVLPKVGPSEGKNEITPGGIPASKRASKAIKLERTARRKIKFLYYKNRKPVSEGFHRTTFPWKTIF